MTRGILRDEVFKVSIILGDKIVIEGDEDGVLLKYNGHAAYFKRLRVRGTRDTLGYEEEEYGIVYVAEGDDGESMKELVGIYTEHRREFSSILEDRIEYKCVVVVDGYVIEEEHYYVDGNEYDEYRVVRVYRGFDGFVVNDDVLQMVRRGEFVDTTGCKLIVEAYMPV